MESSVYLYIDTDNDIFQVFKTLEVAKAFGSEQCTEDSWEDGTSSWGLGEYIKIYKRVIRD